MQSKAASVPQYISELPAERRVTVSTVRDVMRRHMPAGFAEFMGYGMICWGIPLEKYPDSYNGQPLCYAALASHKNHCALYLMNVYADDSHSRELQEAFAAAGKKLDMGKSCIRFRSADALELDVIGRIVASTTPEQFIARTEALHAMSHRPGTALPAKKAGARRKSAAKKSGRKKSATRRTVKKTSGKKQRRAP